MEILLSSAVLLIIFICIMVAEHRASRRSKDLNARTEEQLANLDEHAHARFRAKFGREPTQEHKTDKTDKSDEALK